MKKIIYVAILIALTSCNQNTNSYTLFYLFETVVTALGFHVFVFT